MQVREGTGEGAGMGWRGGGRRGVHKGSNIMAWWIPINGVVETY